jgi:hypothetical protein
LKVPETRHKGKNIDRRYLRLNMMLRRILGPEKEEEKEKTA